MTIATVQFMSAMLWREVAYTALVPDAAAAGPGPYPVLYQLHGGNQSHTSWLTFSRLLHYARELPFIIVFPDGAQSRWANGGTPFTRYEDFLVEELPDHVNHMFPAADGPSAIGGNSMGGFGAVRLALMYPRRFFSVWAHSGGFPRADALPDHWYWRGDGAELDCYTLARSCDPAMVPPLTFDCGRDDHLLDQNRSFHAELVELAVPHAYHEHPGGHTWEYWDTHIPAALEQHLQIWRSLER